MTFPHFDCIPPIQVNCPIFSPSDIETDFQLQNKHCSEKLQSLFFQFNEADKLFNDFYKMGICDSFGKITLKFKDLNIQSSLNDLSIFQQMIHQIKEILTSQRTILNTTFKTRNESIPISISTSLEALFKYVIHLSNENKLKEIDQQSVFKILEIYLIGSSVPLIINKQIFESLAICYFGSFFSKDVIKSWFTDSSHLQDFFSHSGTDLDVRIIISSNQTEAVGSFSNLFLNFLNQQLPSKVFKLLQKRYPHLKNRNAILNSYLLSSTAIKNRVRVKDSHSTFSLIGLNTDTLPIDLNCVGSTFNENKQKYEPSLENSSLTSLNSLSIPLLQFLSSEYPIEEFSSYLCTSGIQTLLDILFNCATPTTHNHFGWRYFLRKYHRMLDPNDEKKMVQSVLEYRKSNDYTIISKHKYLPNPSDIKTLGGFIYLLLSNDFNKVETEKPADPFILSEYLFRACQSLSTYSEMNDEDCLKLWECVEQFYWKPHNRFSETDSIYSAIKTAILEDKIPFSILSAYINILAYLCYPTFTTTHCDFPIINLKIPISIFSRIQLHTNSEALLKYFLKHPFPASLQKINSYFARSSEISLINFPLLPFFSKLDIHPQTLKITLEKWLKIDQPSVKIIGLQLYLSSCPLILNPSFLFDEIALQPDIFNSFETQQQKSATMQMLSAIAEKHFHEAIPLIQQLSKYPFNQYDSKTWLQLLVNANSPYTLNLAYSFFIKHQRDFKEPEIYWSFYTALLTQNHIHKAFFVFHLLQYSQQAIPKNDLIKFFIPLLKQYQCLNPSLKFQYHLSIFKAFQRFFDYNSSVKFKNDGQRLDFSELLFTFIQDHFSIKPYENQCEYYLIEACRLNFLTKYHRHTLLTSRLVQLIKEHYIQHAAVLFLFAVENKWILAEKFIKKNSNDICSKLLSGLLKENQGSFTKDLLVLIKNKIKNEKTSLSTHELIPCCLNQNPLKLYSETEQEILLFLIKMTSKTEKDKVSLLLLEFLETRTPFLVQGNEKLLWDIFEQVLKLKTSNTNREKLLERLVSLLEHTPPTVNMFDWIYAHAEMILKEIEKSQNYQSLKTFIKFIHENNILLKDFENHAWKLYIHSCETDYEDKEWYPIMESFQPSIFMNSIQDEHYSYLLHFLENSFSDCLEDPLRLFHWINGLTDMCKTQKKYLDINRSKKLILDYSEKLIQKGYYSQSIQILLKNLDMHNSEKAILLWNSLGHYIPKASKKELLTLLTDNEKNLLSGYEIPLHVTKKILEKFWKTTDLTNIEWMFLISTMEAAIPYKLTLLSFWWKKLNTLPNNELAHTIIEKSFQFTLELQHQQQEDDYLFLQFLFDRLNCLKKISHPGLIDFLPETESLFILCKDKKTHDLAEKICSLLLEHLITEMNSSPFNERYFNLFQTYKILFIGKIYKENQTAQNLWIDQYDNALIPILECSSSFSARKALCILIQSKLQTVDSKKALKKEILNKIRKQIFIFVTMNHSIKNIDSDYLFLKQMIEEFCNWISSQKPIRENYLNSILTFLVNNPSIESGLLSERIFKNLLTDNSAKELQSFQTVFYQSLTTILKLKEIKLIENYNQLMNLFDNKLPHLNEYEKEIQARYYFFIFEYLINKKMASKELDHQDAMEIAYAYTSYLPFLKNKKEIFEKSLKKIVSIAQIYNLKHPQEAEKAQKKFHQLNFNHFIGYLYSLTENSSLSSSFLIYFKGNLINLIKNTYPKLSLNFILSYADFLLKQVILNPSLLNDTIDFLFLNVFLFPPFNESLNCNIQNQHQNDLNQITHKQLSKFWNQYRKIIFRAEQLDLFKNSPKKLMKIKFWCSQPNENHLSHLCDHLDFLECEFVINCLCHFPESNDCIDIAINMLIRMIERNAHLLENEQILTDKIKPIYLVVLKAICQNEFYSKKEKIDLFFRLMHKTIHNYKIKYKFIFYKIVYPYLKQLISEMPCFLKEKYLTFAINAYFIVVKERLNDEKNWENYINDVKFILPFARRLLVQLFHKPKINHRMYSFDTVIEKLSMILMMKNPKNSIPIFKNRKELLFYWLEILCMYHPNDHEDRKCRILIHLFLYIGFYNENCFAWLDATTSKNKRIKNSMHEMIEKTGTHTEKIILQTLFGLFNFKLEDRIKNIGYLRNIFESLHELPHSADSFKMMKVLFSIFLNWKEQDFEKRTLNLIEDSSGELQEVFEIFLKQVKTLIEKYPESNTPFFLTALINQSFESQWLRPERAECFDFILWVKAKLKIKVCDPTFTLALSVFEHREISNDPRKLEMFWFNLSKEFCEFAHHVVNTKKLSQSWILTSLISSSPISIDLKHSLLNQWLLKLNTNKPDLSTYSLIKHKKELIDYFSQQTQTQFEFNETFYPSNFKGSLCLFSSNPKLLLEEFSLDS